MRIIEPACLVEQTVTRDDVVGHQFNRALVSHEATSTKSLVADLVRFPVGFNHQLHRHPDGDQLVFVLDGQITAYDETGEHEVGPGNAILFEAGTWHGVRVDQRAATILNLFPGVGRVADAGYEASDPPVSGAPPGAVRGLRQLPSPDPRRERFHGFRWFAGAGLV